MKNLKNLFAILFLGITCLTTNKSWSGESFIPLTPGIRNASDDLIHDGKILSSNESDALRLEKEVDLSKLEPQENDLWSQEEHILRDQDVIEVKSSDVLDYDGAILSNTGLFRFNTISEIDKQIYTVHLDKSLHTILLRKNLLRKLGYKVPAMKYFKTLLVRFQTREQLNQFLKKEIPEATLGAPERWYSESLSDVDSLTIKLKDVAITKPSSEDFYNVSLGVPSLVMNSRTLRALVIPYSLLDLYESVNLYGWVAGKIDNKAVILNHFTGNSFGASRDDAMWILRKIAMLSRNEISEMIKAAHFPISVELILTEKIISRRNNLIKLFGLKVEEIKYNSKIEYGEAVKKGKLIASDFPGYASRFAYADAESPMDQVKYYIFAKLQSNIINNVIGKINSQLVSFKEHDSRLKYYEDLFKKGLDHFVKTGEILPIEVGAWYAPVLDAQVILSRDIVLGNYLGTNNMVQLADTFGAGIDTGVMIGIEGVAENLNTRVGVKNSFVRTYSHLRPVKNLKESIKEPYKNMFVPLLKKSLKDNFKSLAELKKKNKDGKVDEINKEVEDLLKVIEKELGVGESLIITDRIAPSANLRVSFNQGLFSAGVGIKGELAVINRIHLYKKGPKLLQIYDDNGNIKDLTLSFDISKYISILNIHASADYGKYSLKAYEVNLSNESLDESVLYNNALGVYNILKNKNFELVSINNKPSTVKADFKDKAGGVSLLWWKLKKLFAKTIYEVETSNGVKGKFFSLEKNKVSGISPESFSKQIVNYYVSKEVEDLKIYDDTASNPANSFMGRSSAKSLKFEAEILDNNKFGQKFLAFSEEKQGWAVKNSTARKFIKAINKKFKTDLFNVDQIDFDKLRLFRLGYHIHIYNRGLDQLHSITGEDIKAIEKKYRKEASCFVQDEKYDSRECGSLSFLISSVSKCDKQFKKNKSEQTRAECSVALFDRIYEDLEFEDFKDLIGEDNLYIYATIDGFREKSEILNDTIYSNTVGTIGSKLWRGPLENVAKQLGISRGELQGSWLREDI